MKISNIFRKTPIYLLIALMVITAAKCTSDVYAQKTGDMAVIKKIVADQDYVFVAETVLPVRGDQGN